MKFNAEQNSSGNLKEIITYVVTIKVWVTIEFPGHHNVHLSPKLVLELHSGFKVYQ